MVPWLTVPPNGVGGLIPDRGRPFGAVRRPSNRARAARSRKDRIQGMTTIFAGCYRAGFGCDHEGD
jgi:hypothetical protein